jgi:HD-like signal output (HDOD) protein
MSAIPILNEEPSLEKLMSRINEMPVLPHVVFKVMEISGSSEFPAAELEKAIVVDPGFSSKLISLANSAYYGLPRKVTSVKEAITFLGFKAIRQLAMTVGVFDLFIGKNDRDSLRRRSWWRQSVDTAVCAKYLASRTKALPIDEAYSAGLFHIMGKNLLDRFGEQSYEKVELLEEHGVDVVRAELAVYKCDHVSLAVAAAQKWGFPEELVVGLEYIEPPAELTRLSVYPACVAVASAISEIALGGFDENSKPLPAWGLEALGLAEIGASELVIPACEAISAAASIQL